MRIYLIIFLCLGLACKKDNKNYSSRFNILNAVPNSTAFTLSLGDVIVDSSIKYGIPVYNKETIAATTNIRWKQNGAGNYDSSLTADIPNGSDFTLLFYDSLNSYKSFLVRDNWEQPASDAKGYIRFFPMVVNGTELRITNDTIKVLIGPTTSGGFTNATGAFTAIDTFSTKLRLFDKNVLLDSLPGTSILPGKSYTLYAIGVLGSTGDKRPKLILHQHE